MIKFFRTFKMSAIETGKLKQYLTYAFGEVLLIVVGILLALQINNWNEARKNKLENRKMLEQIKEENLINQFALQRDKEYRDTIVSVYNGFINLLAMPNLPSHKDEIEQYIRTLFRSTSYSFATSSLVSYLNNNKNDNSLIAKSLLELNSNMSDLEIISKKGFDLKFENFYEGLSEDVDLSSLTVSGFGSLQKFSFRNKMVLNSYVEEEISNKFDITRKQQILVDSLITDYLKH